MHTKIKMPYSPRFQPWVKENTFNRFNGFHHQELGRWAKACIPPSSLATR